MHAIVGKAIADNYATYLEKLGFEGNTHPSDEADSPAFPVEKEIAKIAPDAYGHNITGGAFAHFFCSIGKPEIGALMTCGVDFAAEAPYAPRLKLRPHPNFNAGCNPL